MSAVRLAAYAVACLGVALSTPPAHAQRFRLPEPLADSASIARAMPRLASDVLASYRETNRARALDNTFRLQIIAGRFADAARSVVELRALRRADRALTAEARAMDVQYEIWARAMAAASAGRSFDSSFADAFRHVFAQLDDRMAMQVIRTLTVSPAVLAQALSAAVARQGRAQDIALDDALALTKAYQRVITHRSFGAVVPALIGEDDARRYVTQRDVTVRTPDGATVCALVMRPRRAARLPALLTFTIYVDSAANVYDARRAAASSYVGVTGFTRGKACSPDAPVPYRHDGADADALIDWIAAQPWSDGRVGMYGGSYSGFTAWAATKRLPKALKAIMVGAPVGPGIDVPMEGNIVWNFIYPWPFYTTDNKTLDNATYFDNARWRKLSREWYVSGRAYRELPAIDGTPNPVFAEWISHPTYDAYWQSIVPSGRDFAPVNIPVLQTAGYYYGGPGAAVHYVQQHYANNPAARHYLVIGPYEHVPAQRGVVDALGDTTVMLGGYEIDPAARMDIVADLRYPWFDWILKGGPRPALLADRINYEVMGQNRWKHAPSIAAMANATLRLHLGASRSGTAYRLTPRPDTTRAPVSLRVDLAYRADVDSSFPGGGVKDSAVNRYEALEFISEPLGTMELSGLMSGHLDFIVNKKDLDLSVSAFELTPRGEYVQLPPVQIRASHARDLGTRHLLVPGVRQTLDFTSIRLMSRQIERGSRLVVVIGPMKSPLQQINYGSGKDVNDETIADAGPPLEIRLFSTSHIDFPTRSP